MRILRRLAVPASETQMGLALAFALVIMALIWQANLINYQQGLIRSLWSAKYGGG